MKENEIILLAFNSATVFIGQDSKNQLRGIELAYVDKKESDSIRVKLFITFIDENDEVKSTSHYYVHLI